ncbi:MAG: hemerythrin domain-containing protein [Pseudomonadota bacterium]
MPTPSTGHKAKEKTVPRSGPDNDAIALLSHDHEQVQTMFEQYEALGQHAHASKAKLVNQICTELIKHAAAEEELFYPALRQADSDSEDLIDEALVEHAAAKDLIAQLLAMDAEHDLYDATVRVLSEQVAHHIQEEEIELFPRMRRAGIDLVAMGQAIAERKAEVELPRH